MEIRYSLTWLWNCLARDGGKGVVGLPEEIKPFLTPGNQLELEESIIDTPFCLFEAVTVSVLNL